jgi:hypothetical protein
MNLLDSHEETRMVHDGNIDEYKLRVAADGPFRVDKLFYDLEAYQSQQERIGIKWPGTLSLGAQSIDMINERNPVGKTTKLIIGLRNPVLWFESFYNHRVFGKGETEIAPDPYSLIGGPENMWANLYTDHARFEIGLIKLRALSSKPKVFIYEKDQLGDSYVERGNSFSSALREFLELSIPFEAFPQSNLKESLRFRGKISICDSHYDDLRAHIVHHGKTTARWILNEFLPGDDVFVGNSVHFRNLVERYGMDPCL